MTPRSILCVDDDHVLVDSLAGLFRRKEWRAEVAYSGEQAIEWYGRSRFDVVLLDLRMPPGMDGLETFSRLQKIDGNVCVAFLTGYGTRDLAVDAVRQGAVDMIDKEGTSFDLLFEKLKSSLEQHIKINEQRRTILAGEMLRRLELSLSHRIRNHFDPIDHALGKVRRQVLAKNPDPGVLRSLDIADRQRDLILSTIDELHTFANSRKFALRSIPLLDCVNRSATAAADRQDNFIKVDSEYCINKDLEDGLWVRGNEIFLATAFEVFLINAIDEFIFQRAQLGRTSIATIDVLARRAGERIRVEFRDDGPGFPDAILERGPILFQPSKKETGGGIGLASSQQIIEQCGGQLVLANRTDGQQGAVVTVHLDRGAPETH